MRTGSPMNAEIRGQHEKEYAWFAVADSLPGLSIGAERAAAQIIEACRYGDAEATLSLPARAAVLVNAISSRRVRPSDRAAARLLPGRAGAEGNVARRGRASESRWAPSVATALTDKAAVLKDQTETFSPASTSCLNRWRSSLISVAASRPISRAKAAPTLPPGGLYCSLT